MQKSIVRFAHFHASPRFMRWLLIAAAFGAALLLTPQGAAAQACEDPKVLRFSIIPTQESVRELTLYMPTSYSPVVEALLGKWVDVAVLGPDSCLIAKNQGA